MVPEFVPLAEPVVDAVFAVLVLDAAADDDSSWLADSSADERLGTAFDEVAAEMGAARRAAAARAMKCDRENIMMDVCCVPPNPPRSYVCAKVLRNVVQSSILSSFSFSNNDRRL